MFRRPKKAVKKAGFRSRKDDDDGHGEVPRRKRHSNDDDDDDDDEEESTSALLSEARKRTKQITGKAAPVVASETSGTKDKSVMHQYTADDNENRKRKQDLVTSTVEIHSEKQQDQHVDGAAERGDDGIFRDKTRSKLLAGPIKATTHIRTTCRFDYQPDICKDYKETGFCGFGDTCIYLHDRGDTLTGWQLEKQWEEEQKKKKEQQEREIQGFVDGTNDNNNEGDEKNSALTSDDGIPYACHICRNHFTNPVVTTCNHYFCEKCIMDRVKTESESCPICGKDTHGVFNKPTKLLSKRRRVLGASEASKENAWEEFAKAFNNKE